MVPQVTKTTSVAVKFYDCSDNVIPLSATLTDHRNHVNIFLDCCGVDVSQFIGAHVFIDRLDKTRTQKMKSYSLRLGHNKIGTSDTVSSSDIRYEDFTQTEEENIVGINTIHHCIKIKALTKSDGEIVTSFSRFSYGPNVAEEQTSYKYIYRYDGGDFFSEESGATNHDEIEQGSKIVISAPLTVNRDTEKDSRVPHSVLVTFDEKDYDDYANYGETNDNPDNSEKLDCYSEYVNYSEDGIYTLENIPLENDRGYAVNIVAFYHDGHTVSKTLSSPIHVIERPVITEVVAYGLNLYKTGAGEPTITTLMNVTMREGSVPVRLPIIKVDNISKIKFYLKQGTVTYYTITKDLSSNTFYRIEDGEGENDAGIDFQDMVRNGSVVPDQEENGFFKFDVYAQLDYVNPSDENVPIIKISEPYAAVFNSDINKLSDVTIRNAWVAASVVNADGVRKVMNVELWENSPEIGIMGKFRKHDFYGSGVQNGLYKDLDLPGTKHKFMLSKTFHEESNNAIDFVPVTMLYQIQGHDDKSDIDMYNELLTVNPINSADGTYDNLVPEAAQPGSVQPYIFFWVPHPSFREKYEGASELNGVKTVLTSSQLTQFKSQSQNIITYSASGNEESGWSIKNTGPNTSGATNGALPKVNLYFYAYSDGAAQTSANSFTMAQAAGVGMYAVFYQNATAKEYPFFNVYTAKQGNTGNMASWYRSKIFYGPSSHGGDTVADPSRVGLTLAFIGDDDGSLFPEIPAERRVKFVRNNNFSALSNADDDSVTDGEFVKYLTLQTSSNAATSSAGSFNFRLLETGMLTTNPSYNKISFMYNQPKHSSPSSLYDSYETVALSIAIEPPTGETTRPDAAVSSQHTVVNRINRYSMTVGESSEPNFYNSGENGRLEVPINNPIHIEGSNKTDRYFVSATFESDDSRSLLVTANATQENNGIFNIIVENPEKRGINNQLTYKVHYTIDDPNESNALLREIKGPDSESYIIPLCDEPTTDSFTISNYTYNTFNINHDGEDKTSISSFVCDIFFFDHGVKGIDGINVYFQSDDDLFSFLGNTETKRIEKIHLLDVNRSNTDDIYSLSKILASVLVDDSNSIEIIDSSNNTYKWKHFGAGRIMFEPYITPPVITRTGDQIKMEAETVSKPIYNIVPLLPVEDMMLAGGVVESGDAVVSWTNKLNYYTDFLMTASYDASLNGASVTITENDVSYDIVLDANVTYKFELVVKLELDNNDIAPPTARNHYSDKVTLTFTSYSVDLSTMVSNISRSSNSNVVKVITSDYITNSTDRRNLNVTRLEIVDNKNMLLLANNTATDPLNSTIVVLKHIESSEYTVSELNGNKTVLTSSQLAQFKGTNTIITAGNERNGWSIKNTGPNTNGATNGALPKVNLYFYAYSDGAAQTSANSFTMAQAAGVGMYAVFYQNATAKEYPFFNVYTATQGNTGNVTSWYRSKIFYGPSSHGGDTVADPSRVGLTLAFIGDDDGSLFPEIPAERRVKFVRNNNFSALSNADDSVTDGEFVKYLTLQTSSNAATSSAGSFNFRLLETGMLTTNPSYNKISLMYNQPNNQYTQLVGENTWNRYNLQSPGVYNYVLSDLLHLVFRMEAGVKYALNSVSYTKNSLPKYLNLVPSTHVKYRVGNTPEVSISNNYQIIDQTVGDEVLKLIKLPIKLDANGLKDEGVQSIVILIGQEGDYTDETDPLYNEERTGVQLLLSFSMSNVVESYDIMPAIVSGNPTHLGFVAIGPNKELNKFLYDVDGLYEGNTLNKVWKFYTGSLDSNDTSYLLFPSGFEGSFQPDKSIFTIVVATTRLGSALDLKSAAPPA